MYRRYSNETIQTEIFDKIFISVDDPETQTRLNFEQLIELVNAFIFGNSSQKNINQDTYRDDNYHDEKQLERNPESQEDEVIEEEYYDEEDAGQLL